MADFVAVIRRAVDGLSDNTPELRAKVYEKARSAVLRQLESMKPRPPEEMLRRQLDKLESAILSVEAEHSEALPSIEEPLTIEPESVPPAEEAVPEPANVPVETTPTADYPQVSEENPPATIQPVAVEPPVADVEPVRSIEIADTRSVEAETWPKTAAEDALIAPPPEPEPSVQEPVTYAAPAAATPPAPAAGTYLWGDESWEDEPAEPPEATSPAPSYALPVEPEPEWAPEPEPENPPAFEEPVQAEKAEPVADLQPVADPYAHPYDAAPEPLAAAEPVLYTEPSRYAEDAYADFPVEDPTEKYRQPPVPEPEVEPLDAVFAATTGIEASAHPLEDWPEGGMNAPVSATVEEESWSAPAHLDELPDAETQHEVAGISLAEQAELEPVDPFSWTPEPVAPQMPVPEPEPVHAELAAAAYDPYDDPLLAQASGHTEARVEPAPYVAQSHADDHQPANYRQDSPLDDPEWDQSPFNDVELPRDRQTGSGRGGEPEDGAWDQFNEYNNYTPTDQPAADTDADHEFLFTPVDKPARSYRIEPKRRIDLTSVGLGLLGLLLVAGSGYGAWVFRDTLSGLVTGLVSSPPSQDQKSADAPATSTPSGEKPASTQTPATSGTGAAPSANETASADTGETELQKFTQRLKADGTEIDEGKAAGSGSGEGKSVAPQTVASNDAVEATTPAGSASTAANPAVIPVGVTQKMFLYEERTGQTSPAAIEGAVVWSLKHEMAENGKNEAMVQGQVTAPERGLSALITVKRNLDPSLPASHLVELVFSLPKDFEGGAIESVQRVALKQTEQDRGDPLIAVPAKITDDFHMIALNDFADARKFNLNLLLTRDWIDIPLTYRNGRRALLTMEKGATGAEAFSQAIREWESVDGASAAPAPSAPSQPASTPVANP